MERANVFDVATSSKFRQFLEIAVVLGMISWSTACVPPVLKTAAEHAVRCSAYLLNHHVVFLIGNFIIVCLFVLFRRNDAAEFSGTGDLYDDYVRRSAAAAPPPPPAEEKRMVARSEETVEVPKCDDVAETVAVTKCDDVAETVAITECDEVAAAIEKAERQIRRFQRTQSEKLRREIGARPRAELRRLGSENRRRSESGNRRRSVCSGENPFGAVDMESESRRRSESDNRRRSVSSGEKLDGTVDMERLSSEDFQRTVDAFITKHWIKKTTPYKDEDLFELKNIIY